MQLIYVGRLDQEKGMSSILYCIKKLNKQNFHFHIYGAWHYEEHVKQLATQYPHTVSYYGRQDKKSISAQWTNCDFFLMTSTFLETFGLTACESLLLWVPVIGNKKWWLIPFIHPELNLQAQDWKNDKEKLFSLLQHLSKSKRDKEYFRSFINDTQQHYSSSERYHTIKKLIDKENILMVSDFINYNGWWIETNIHDTAHILQGEKHTVLIYGHQAPKGKFSRLKKLFVMWLSIANILDSFVLTKKVKKENVWLIRRHSISRVIGRLPLCIIWKVYQRKWKKQIITHHELWLFHPYPSQVNSYEQIPTERSLSAFIQAGQTTNIFKKISIVGKYLLIRLIHKQLQTYIHTHIVPSERMIPMVKARHPQSQVICIPHFVSITKDI